MRNQIVIRVEIADKMYKMTINSDEEEIVRRAARRIKDEIRELHTKYEASYIEYLAMAALKISIENEVNIGKIKYNSERQQIEKMTEELKDYLEKDKNL
ncbi:hypothetical protein BN938_1382 [Mucinivorans hirudinis]|uniref:Cell division protein ZapA n=1 Tax=Mucinivorans hirudinis TaxID=1433126 RepID=A0A060RD29_9BACT|nr:hypothetical protein BN938_1382 [Mucinivorans hirudinis]